MPDIWLAPTYHPSFIMHDNRKFDGVVRYDFERIAALLHGKVPVDHRRLEGAIYNPSVDTIRDVLRQMRGTVVVYDIETDGGWPPDVVIRCIGLYNGKIGMVIPFLYRVEVGGRREWVPFYGANTPVVMELLDSFFRDQTTTFVGQNAQYDKLCLNYKGVPNARYDHDTMICHHVVTPYLPHGLGFLTSLYTDMAYYKTTEEGEAWSSQSDEDLARYCLHGSTSVVMADGSRIPIAKVVREKMVGPVKTMLPTGEIVTRPITNWYRNRVAGQSWVEIYTTATGAPMRVTPDHKVFTERGWIRADSLRIGDITRETEPKIPVSYLRALIGTCLGDSSLVVSPTYRSQRLVAPAASVAGRHRKDSGVTQMKVGALGPFACLESARPGKPVIVHGRRGLSRESLGWSTPMFSQLAPYLPRLYTEDGTRLLEPALVEEIGAEGLAWWFIDDGCRQNGRRARGAAGSRGGRLVYRDKICLALQRYPRREAERLTEWFRQKFGACHLDRAGVLRLGVPASILFCRFVAPFVPDQYRYKFPRNEEWPSFVGLPKMNIQMAQPARIVKIQSGVYSRRTKSDRHHNDTRWCIDVEGTHCFFTPQGLVHNCLQDCIATWLSWMKLKDEVQEDPTDFRLYNHDLAYAREIERWRRIGFFIDQGMFKKLREKYQAMSNEALYWLRCIAGSGVIDMINEIREAKAEQTKAFTLAARKLGIELDDDEVATVATFDPFFVQFNPRSLPKLRSVFKALKIPLTVETKSGQLSTAEEVLNDVRAHLIEYEKVGARDRRLAFLDYLFAWREPDKIIGTFLDPKFISSDGCVHAAYSIHIVPTGRLSCKHPNCFDQETDILTERGWVPFPDLVKNGRDLRVAQWDDGVISLERPTAYFEAEADEFVHIHSEQIDLCVTDDHRCLLETRKGVRRVVLGAEYPEDHKQLNAGVYAGGPGLPFTNDELIVLCAVQADGTWRNQAKYGVDFTFSKKRKIRRLTDALRACGVAFTNKSKKQSKAAIQNGWRPERRIGIIPCDLIQRIGRLLGPDKRFGPWLLDATTEQLDFIARELNHWDGCHERNTAYCSVVKNNVDWAQIIYALSGRRARIATYTRNARLGRGQVAYTVGISQRAYSWTTNRKMERTPGGPCYCVSVPSGFVVVRRNGKVSITGQCQNQPKDIRKMYVARPGKKLVCGDWDSGEFRLMGYCSGEKNIIDMFDAYDAGTGPKPHKVNCSRIFKIPVEKVDGDDPKIGPLYRAAKVFIYAIAYGASANTIYKNVRKEMPDLEPDGFAKIYKTFKDSYPTLIAWQKSWVARGKRDHILPSPVLGRKIYFLEESGDDSPEVARMLNAPEQCVPGFERVITDVGYLPIESLVGRTFKAWTGQEWAEATAIQKDTVEIFRARLDRGIYLYCDATHSFWVPGRDQMEWRAADSVNQNGRIALDLARPLEFGNPLNEEDAYFTGLWMADGSFRTTAEDGEGRLSFCIGDTKGAAHGQHYRGGAVAQTRCREWLEAHGLQSFTETGHGCVSIRTTKGGIVLLQSLGLLSTQRADSKRIPDRIWCASLAARKAFLKGFLDGDGSGTPDNGVTISCCQRELLDDLWMIARTCGIDGTIHGPYPADKNGHVAYRLLLRSGQVWQELKWGNPARTGTRETVPPFMAQASIQFLVPHSASDATIRSRLKHNKMASTSPYVLSRMGAPDIYDFAVLESLSPRRVKVPVYTLCVAHPRHSYVVHGVVAKNSGLADIVGLANLRIVRRYVEPLRASGEYCEQLGQIHDELIFEVDDKEADNCSRKFKSIAEEPPDEKHKNWRMPVEVKVKNAWGDK